MNIEEILEIANSNPSMQLATIDDAGAPRTRGMMLYNADRKGIVFTTGGYKDLYRQLKSRPQVEVSFFDSKQFLQVRIQGGAVEIDDNEVRWSIVNSPGREFLKPVAEKLGIEAIKVFRVEQCTAQTWNMDNNQEYPKTTYSFQSN